MADGTVQPTVDNSKRKWPTYASVGGAVLKNSQALGSGRQYRLGYVKHVFATKDDAWAVACNRHGDPIAEPKS